VVVGLRGVARITQGHGPAIDLHPGDAVVVAPGATHDHAPLRGQSAALALGFDSGMCDVVLSTATVQVDAVMPQHPAWSLVHRLSTKHADALPELLSLVLDRPLQATQPLPTAVARMRDYIRSHGLTPITAADLARVSGLGTSRAWQVFRHHFGCTPRQALEQRRCAVAAAMLRHGLAIPAIITRCGFHDRGTFTRAFARQHGQAPAQWRDQLVTS
jgi:AraC-like DNA-binding protein